MNAVRTFEGDDSSFTNDQIIAIAERIQEMRKDAKEHGACGPEKDEAGVAQDAGIRGLGAYDWDR